MISIGTPEVGSDLMNHLSLKDGDEYVFADPTNSVHDAVRVNRGVQNTFFNINTPFAFLDRFTKKGGMTDLNEVLGKWNKAIYIPPKPFEQGLIQGATFVFDGPNTIYAHYDESTGSHANIDKVLQIAKDRVKLKKQN